MRIAVLGVVGLLAACGGSDRPSAGAPVDDLSPSDARHAAAAPPERLAIDALLGPAVPVDTYDWGLPGGVPRPRVPADNPMTAEKVALGRHIFHDPRLSGNGTQSCASCHRQERAFTDGRPRGVGSTGEVHPRNSMALVNVAYNASYTWGHPGLVRVEDQIRIPLFGSHPVEMGVTGREDEVLGRLRAERRYDTLFAAAFPGEADPMAFPHVVQALASFSRALISADSPYDRFVYARDSRALSLSARRGLNLFMGEDFECHHCHSGFNLTVSTVSANSTFVEQVFHNTGLYDLGDGAYPPGGRGVFEVTEEPDDMGRFRPPTLRNVAVTGPYMHDGSIATLDEVIETYAAGGRRIDDGPYAGDGRGNPHKSGFVPGFPITDAEQADLVAFLESLTDSTFLTDARFSDPWRDRP